MTEYNVKENILSEKEDQVTSYSKISQFHYGRNKVFYILNIFQHSKFPKLQLHSKHIDFPPLHNSTHHQTLFAIQSASVIFIIQIIKIMFRVSSLGCTICVCFLLKITNSVFYVKSAVYYCSHILIYRFTGSVRGGGGWAGRLILA